jgi:hypothetical protein
MPSNYFGDRIAERYDETAADMFDPSVVEPVVDLLADLALGSVLAGSRYH